MSAALAEILLPELEEMMLLEGRLDLPDSHDHDLRLGGKCLVCLLRRKSLDGERVRIWVDVEDVE